MPNIVWKPQPGPQTKLLECPIEDIFFGGARGGGKTDGLLGHWLSHCNKYAENARGVFFRKSTPELEEVQRRALELFSPLGAVYKASPRTWIMKNGSTLKMRFLENDQDSSKYQGHSYTWAAFDEMPNWASPDPIDKIRATLRSAAGVPCRFLSSGNPGGIGQDWVKERYVKPSKPLVPFFDDAYRTRRVFIPSRLSDNKILQNNDPTYVDRLRSSGPSWLVKAWLEGDWNSLQEGSIFKREWWMYYREEPNFVFKLQSWDTAFKTKQENDYSVCTTWGVADNGYYLLDVWKQRVEFPDLKRAVIQLAAKFNPNKILIEDKASGQSLGQEMARETRLPIKLIQIDRDKVARANSVTPSIESKKVFLPESAPWVIDYVDSLASFPHGSHDDDVDSTTQALSELILFKKPPPTQFNFNMMR